MPDLSSTLCFLAPLPKYKTEKPFRIIPGAGETFDHHISNVVPDVRENVRIVDIRGRLNEFNFEEHGFEVLSHKSSQPILDDKAQVDAYKMEIEQLLKTHLDAEKVIVFDFRVSVHHVGIGRLNEPC
jgi:hypothetical protein